ncbi:biopolymer transporter ExbD [Candidatus Cyanaurora vandensis]|uniref:ExbD/TolR family protein n=1 Tax=Candidatus Cyanaurora vandensis TaxID=2714958 RepID=UPI00257DBD37|nr:biopolymer transporter ExbD [Candidatus Cyanaurora vandensis]
MRLPPISDEFPEVPVVPLIDVMFTLLTFFIVATLFIQKNRALDLNLPQANSTPIVETKKIEQVDVSVDKDGNFYYNKDKVSGPELLARLKKLSNETLLILAGDDKTRYQDLVSALDILRLSGKTRIALAERALK